jgi:hypothetical protein
VVNPNGRPFEGKLPSTAGAVLFDVDDSLQRETSTKRNGLNVEGMHSWQASTPLSVCCNYKLLFTRTYCASFLATARERLHPASGRTLCITS